MYAVIPALIALAIDLLPIPAPRMAPGVHVPLRRANTPTTSVRPGIHWCMKRSLLNGKIDGEIPHKSQDSPEHCKRSDEDDQVFQGIGSRFCHSTFFLVWLLKKSPGEERFLSGFSRTPAGKVRG